MLNPITFQTDLVWCGAPISIRQLSLAEVGIVAETNQELTKCVRVNTQPLCSALLSYETDQLSPEHDSLEYLDMVPYGICLSGDCHKSVWVLI